MSAYENAAPLSGPPKPSAYLKFYGFERPLRTHGWFPWVAGVAAFALLIALSHMLLPLIPKTSATTFTATGISTTTTSRTVLDLIVPAVMFLGLLYTLQQWQGSRREVSIDRYYDRLDLTNRRWESSAAVREAMGSTDADDEVFLYVCLELDNLEYVVEKYRIGYMGDEQACRGLKTFEDRCLKSPEFLRIARQRVHDGDYTTTTTRVVCRVCDAVDERVERDLAAQRALNRNRTPRSQAAA